MSAEDFSYRLRQLRNNNDWTVQEMSRMTGVPKRTLDKYMLKEDAAQPGLDAILKIARGLGVSLDWLLLGEDSHALSQGVMARLCARAGALPHLQALIKMFDSDLTRSVAISDGKIMGMTPEELALEIAYEAGRRAETIAAYPARADTLYIGEIAVGLKSAKAKKQPVGQDSENLSE